MNYKIFLFALLFGGMFLYGCSTNSTTKEDNQNSTSNLEFGKENTQFRNTETKNLSPYAMFGDSSFVLMSQAEREGKHSLDIENENIARIELDLHIGRMRIFDKKGVLIKESFLNTEDFARFLSIDRFASKYPSNSPYGYAANNPVFYVDVNGDSLGFHDTHQDLINGFEKQIIGSFDNHVTVQKAADGSFIGLKEGTSAGAKKYFEQEHNKDAFKALADVFQGGKFSVELINTKDERATRINFGSFDDEVFDIDDFAVVGNKPNRINTRSTIIHESTEQYKKQVEGLGKDKAHHAATSAENLSYSEGGRMNEGTQWQLYNRATGGFRTINYTFIYKQVEIDLENKIIRQQLMGIEYEK